MLHEQSCVRRLGPSGLAVLLVAAGMLSLAGAFVGLHLTSPSDGARLEPGGGAWRTNGVVVAPIRSQPGGLKEGDLVVAVGGRSMEAWARSLLDVRVKRPEWTFGQMVAYHVMRDGESLEVPVTLGRYPVGAILRQEWPSAISTLAILLVAGFVFVKRPAERAAQVLLLGASGGLASATWSFGLQVTDIVGGLGFWLYVPTAPGFYPLLFASMVHFVLIFPKPQQILKRQPWIVPALYVAPYVYMVVYALWTRSVATSALVWFGQAERALGAVELVYGCLLLVATVTGYRAARDPISRQQVRWVAFAFVVAGFVFLAFGIVPAIMWGAPLVSANILGLVGLLIPVAIAVSILRYRLFDIDLVLNRTLVYGALMALVIATHGLVVGSFGALFQSTGNLLVALLATGLAAVLLLPLRDRLQRGVNRLMYGERNDPYTVLSHLGQRLEATLEPGAELPTIVETVAQALKLPFVAIALRDGEAFRTAASCGIPVNDPVVLPLTHQGEIIGQLICAPRAPGEEFTPADRRLLESIARQAGTVAHVVRLAGDLQRSRARLVTAREEERRRLRRDLHDGLGPQLASLILKTDAARNLLPHDPDAAATLLGELKAQTQDAIADIRRLVYNLRPPPLDELGLVAALHEHAATLGAPDGLRVSVEAPESLPPLPAAVEVAAYRIALEALTNVTRHANAKTCVVRFALDDALQLEIVDDGNGLPQGYQVGVGLASMRERATELGGNCEIGPAPNGGTRVLARLPLSPVEE